MIEHGGTPPAVEHGHGGMPRRRKIAYGVLTVFVVAAFMGFFFYFWNDQQGLQDSLKAFLENARGSAWALPVVVGCYVVGGLVLFPITVLNLVVAMVFGLWGIAYGLIGVMANTAFFYSIGLLLKKYGGHKWLEHPKIKPVDKKIKDVGLAGLVAFHALPAPPFSMLNIIAGVSSIGAGTYFLATFLAMLPGAIARGVVGESLTKILLNPTPESFGYLAFGIALWIVLVGGAHILLKKFEKKETRTA